MTASDTDKQLAEELFSRKIKEREEQKRQEEAKFKASHPANTAPTIKGAGDPFAHNKEKIIPDLGKGADKSIKENVAIKPKEVLAPKATNTNIESGGAVTTSPPPTTKTTVATTKPPINHPPKILGGQYNIYKGAPLKVDLLKNHVSDEDGDALKINIVNNPKSGSFIISKDGASYDFRWIKLTIATFALKAAY